MRNELRKRLKGLMALVLCVGMMFGNSMMVLAANTYDPTGSSMPSVLNNGDVLKAEFTNSGGIKVVYHNADGAPLGEKVSGGAANTYTVVIGEGISSEYSSWIVLSTNEANVSISNDNIQVHVVNLQGIGTPGGGAGHTHTFEWDMTTLPTRTEDGEASYICHECGCVEATQPVTRWQWFMKQYRELIKNAEQNATVTFEADDMPCISDYMLGLNAGRPDVTMVIHFVYEGVSYELTIPAGTDFSVIQNDADGFYGYLGLAAKLGLTAKVVG